MIEHGYRMLALGFDWSPLQRGAILSSSIHRKTDPA